MSSLRVSLPIVLLMSRVVAVAVGQGMNFTVWSAPVRLHYGEVHNTMQWDPRSGINNLPPDVVNRYAAGDRLMAITGFDMDMVRVDKVSGKETPVPLNDHYLHHYILGFGGQYPMQELLDSVKHDSHMAHMLTGCHGMKRETLQRFQVAKSYGTQLGSAAGAEYRHNPQRFPAPYRLLLFKPEVWAPTLHIINTNTSNSNTQGRNSWPDPKVSPLLECPCTPQRIFNLTAGTIDGKPADPPIHCSKQFAATGNPSCNLSTYVGGWRCCEHGMFVIDTNQCAFPDCRDKRVDEVFMKFTFYYEDGVPETRNIEAAACCDVTQDFEQGNENIEHDVPACASGTPVKECIFVAENVQPLGYYDKTGKTGGYKPSDLIDLVFAAPHLHYAGISIELIDHATNETLCEVHQSEDNQGGVMYGHGTTVGDEEGYLVGLRPCTWQGSQVRRYTRDHLMRTRVVYNASTYHTGVMSLWLSEVSPVRQSRGIIV